MERYEPLDEKIYENLPIHARNSIIKVENLIDKISENNFISRALAHKAVCLASEYNTNNENEFREVVDIIFNTLKILESEGEIEVE